MQHQKLQRKKSNEVVAREERWERTRERIEASKAKKSQLHPKIAEKKIRKVNSIYGVLFIRVENGRSMHTYTQNDEEMVCFVAAVAAALRSICVTPKVGAFFLMFKTH